MKTLSWGLGLSAALAFATFGLVAEAQQKAPDQKPAATTKAPPAPKAPAKAASACKGLDETACKGNAECAWVVPKKAGKTGKVQAAYCRKVAGVAKKKTK